MEYGWPQYLFLVLYATNILGAAALHGTATRKEWNVVSSLLATAIAVFILKSGGFF